MKKFLPFILCIIPLSFCTLILGPKGAESPEQLLQLCEKYHHSQHVLKMMRLYKTEGVSPTYIKTHKRTLKKYFSRRPVDFAIKYLTDEEKIFFNQTFHAQRQSIKYNLDLIGQISVQYEGNYQEAFLFGKEEEKYFFGLQVDISQTTNNQ